MKMIITDLKNNVYGFKLIAKCQLKPLKSSVL